MLQPKQAKDLVLRMLDDDGLDPQDDVLQDVVRYDPNNYVRLVSEQTLEDLNASIGLY